jgi:hypothetical protein
MSERLSLLFVCEDSDACFRFQRYLKREGCSLVLATDTERAARTLLCSSVAAVLIHLDNIPRGSIVACGLKLISPQTPMLLITGEWPINVVCPPGVDALCRATFLNRRAAHKIAKFVRYFLFEEPQDMPEGWQYRKGRFVVQRPMYMN